MDVIILCGGLGKRLKAAVSDRPKTMAAVGKEPFMDILIDYIADFRFKRFILCAGHMGDFIETYYKEKKKEVEILVSTEKKLLGTAGAVKNAERLVKSDSFLVMNGDCFCPLDYNDFVEYHKSKESELTLALVKEKNSKEYGAVALDDVGRIVSFSEKENRKNTFLSVGIYIFNRGILALIPSGKPSSLEYDIFPGITARKCFGYVTKEKFIDIGTPERYKKAQNFIKAKRPKVK